MNRTTDRAIGTRSALRMSGTKTENRLPAPRGGSLHRTPHPLRRGRSGRPDPPPAHTVRNAMVGGIREARTAGIRPANAPITMADAMPPDHASTGITTAQFFELAYTAVAAA